MSNTVIKVENLSKQYRLGEVGTGTISHDLNRWWAKMRGKEDPFLKIGETNDRTSKGNSDYVWALKDINFDIQQGDAVGIIGRNGAGKSTLLKILSKTTTPNTGSIKIKGRIASLLEVGTGFHPEMTGRENIFLNGAILGMRKKEIARKFDEIVDFAGVERYVDTPVKRYSSGMYVRLAFAVAAHLESEILIVDEVLAVGDAEFQKKCLGKMGEVSKGEGRTVLFVSHNMGSVQALCQNSILLENGIIKLYNKTEQVISEYIKLEINDLKSNYIADTQVKSKQKAFIKQISVLNKEHDQTTMFDVFDEIILEIEYTLNVPLESIHLCINLKKDYNIIWRSFDTDLQPKMLRKRNAGKFRYRVRLTNPLKAGKYSIDFFIGIVNSVAIDTVEDAISFEVTENSFDPSFKSYSQNRSGIIPAILNWEAII